VLFYFKNIVNTNHEYDPNIMPNPNHNSYVRKNISKTFEVNFELS